MEKAQFAWLASSLPSHPPFRVLSYLFGRNLLPPVPPPPFAHASLSPHYNYLKFLTVSYLGMYVSRSFAKDYGSTWDTELSLSVFLNHNLLGTLSDLTLIYLVGRLRYRRGVDCANFLLPMFGGATLWELFGTHPELSKNLSSLGSWTGLTYVVFLTFMCLVAAVLVLHVRRSYKDGLLPGRFLELFLMLGLGLGPIAGNEGFHLHHWAWAWLGAMAFNLRYGWSFAVQGFMVGMYVNGIGIWGRDPLVYDR
ncbi:hypothetical protein TrCOL_g6574 [Triparma columacea]|uniref:Uncharacterized protein n=1 Tax=Triparma columacea TaxID=722753 RepID=A0A9W7LEH9_9STRA|nr:hypothetical protein TrCOL_g6574 [Triparma columacea]